MGRGARVQIPPLHSLADVLGLCLLLIVLVLIVRWIMGSNPLQDLAGLLSPPAVATVLQIEIGLAEATPDLTSMLPVREKASPSAALDLAHGVGQALLEQRERWTLGSLRAVRLKEAGAAAGWEAAWQHAQRGSAEVSVGTAGLTVVTLIALVRGRSLRLPGPVTADEIARFVAGLGVLDVHKLEAFGAVASPAPASAGDMAALGLVAI